MDSLPVPPDNDLRLSLDGDASLKHLERQIERSQIFAHTALGESFTRLGEAEVFLHSLIDLLLTKGMVKRMS